MKLMTNSVLKGALQRLPVGGLIGKSLLGAASSLLSQGYSRDQELDADRFAGRLAALAGFEAEGGVRLLDRLVKDFYEG